MDGNGLLTFLVFIPAFLVIPLFIVFLGLLVYSVVSWFYRRKGN